MIHFFVFAGLFEEGFSVRKYFFEDFPVAMELYKIIFSFR